MAYRNVNETTSNGASNQTHTEQVSNLLDVQSIIKTDADLDPIYKRDELSSLSMTQKVVGVPLDMISAVPNELRQTLERAHPARFGLSRSRWSNIRSLLARALRRAGVDVRVRHRLPLSPAWQHALASLPVKPHRVSIVPFARWCSSLDILPMTVTQEVAEQYLHMLEYHDLRFGRRDAYCKFVRMWNTAHEHSIGWPKIKLTLVNRRDWYAQPLSVFPQSFQDDVAAMLEDAQSPLNATNRSHIRPVTAQGQLARIRAIASALVLSGWEKSRIQSITDLVEVDAARAILNFMIKRQGVEKGGLPFADAILCVRWRSIGRRCPTRSLKNCKVFGGGCDRKQSE